MRTIDDVKAELIRLHERLLAGGDGCEFDICGLAKEAAEALENAVVLPLAGERGELSDGYHTFDELYEQRAVLFSTLCRLFPGGAWKSKLHADGTMFDGHFIVGIETPDGQYTYHYGLDKWDWFPVRTLDHAPEWDGHIDKDVRRLWSLPPYTEEAAQAALKARDEHVR